MPAAEPVIEEPILGPQSAPVRCRQHPGELAGWRCQACGAALCPECAEERRVQTVELVACGACGGTTQPLLVHRGVVPLTRRLRGIWRYPFTSSGLQLLVGVSLFLAAVAWMTRVSFPVARIPLVVLYGGVFWATFFGVVRGSARGDTSLEAPDFSDIFRDALLPGLRGLATFAIVWLPALGYALLTQRAPNAALGMFYWYIEWSLPPALVADPVFWVLVVMGALWLPMALLMTAAGQPPWAIVDPRLGWRLLQGLGRDYWVATGALAVLGVLHAVAHGVATGLRLLDLTLISDLLAEAVTLVVPLLAAHVLGLLLYVRGDSVGYGVARDYVEPVLGGTRPRRRVAPLGEAMPTAQTAQVVEAATEARATSAQLADLGAAVEARDVPRAMALYAELGQLPALRIPPAHHLFVGQVAATEGDFPLAVQALERAADVAPDDPTAPRALVLLARVLGERMNDVARAEEVYRYVLHRYPDTNAARFASERVRPTSG
ncbi:hypothetical protein LZ198_02550 [Myxococcus sp. K15C18031901]|uniref:hypothetical protein n=1 Tax=Myxococcus dinghuensis TaxID=2906761 RepID=UPI0020A75908|nr:hypothetical protein [Myxococcus dinghuensis]MCP3097752.1 hypothetical protein [Myxococcus dinghuensis]